MLVGPVVGLADLHRGARRRTGTQACTLTGTGGLPGDLRSGRHRRSLAGDVQALRPRQKSPPATGSHTIPSRLDARRQNEIDDRAACAPWRLELLLVTRHPLCRCWLYPAWMFAMQRNHPGTTPCRPDHSLLSGKPCLVAAGNPKWRRLPTDALVPTSAHRGGIGPDEGRPLAPRCIRTDRRQAPPTPQRLNAIC